MTILWPSQGGAAHGLPAFRANVEVIRKHVMRFTRSATAEQLRMTNIDR